jgi:two-component system, OmpR family, phosphate regulon sensor histidine kinase PhoR
MFFNSRAVASVIAFTIALITTAFLSLVETSELTELLVCAGLAFISSFLLIYYTLEFLIFRELKNVHEAIEKIKKKDFSLNIKPVSWHANPFKKINQEFISYASVKQKEIDELKKIETFRREFLADISHELKTPIFAAQGFVHTLLDGAIEDKKVRTKFLKKAAKSLDGLDMMVQDLLTLSQMETGEIKMHKEPFDIVTLTLEVFDQFDEKALKKHITLQVEETQEPVIVYADKRRIAQVLNNLISNAIKYGRENGTVIVFFSVDREHVLVSIKDDGIGIPPEHLKRIFERFYRVEKSRSKDKGGTGLGLAIVKHIVEAHDSRVSVVSTVKKGTTFSFRLSRPKRDIAE